MIGILMRLFNPNPPWCGIVFGMAPYQVFPHIVSHTFLPQGPFNHASCGEVRLTIKNDFLLEKNHRFPRRETPRWRDGLHNMFFSEDFPQICQMVCFVTRLCSNSSRVEILLNPFGVVR
jgi:hypothetical protein